MGTNTETLVLPGSLQLNQACVLQFRSNDEPLNATVVGVNFHKGTVKYDLELIWDETKYDIVEQRTRIYNVHSKYLTAL